MSIKDKLYYRLVEKDNTIKRAYQGYINENPERHKKHRVQSWLFLLSLIFQRRVCGRVVRCPHQRVQEIGCLIQKRQ